ncbi:hypothetical protein Tco_0838521 [Tanacetum coccineum]|uniref:DUF4219 domain-containing protein/UBN2 domain-containing protein n=1 Tax=Tanacetum coccineum TaxID=301880 RepID=A0ABQ5AT08_9ASTR
MTNVVPAPPTDPPNTQDRSRVWEIRESHESFPWDIFEFQKKNRFETYVKAKDLDLWHIILNGDFPPVARNKETQVLEMVPFEQQDDDLKKKLAKNNEAKMVLYNALPKKEYERIFMCKTAKDIWQSLLITHQGNSQVKDNKIDLLVQQYEQFTILEEESIDSGFARFNTIITSLKALDEGFFSKNYVRKFLRALHPKWRAKVTAIKESKDLSSLALDELIENLKVHEVVMEKDFEIYRGKNERVKSIALKAKKESSDDETLTSGIDDEEYAMAVRNFKKCGDLNHLIGNCPKPSRNKDQKGFIGGSWSDSENDAKDKTNDKTCLMAQSLNEVTFNSSYYSDNASSLDNDSIQIEYDSLCEIILKIINKNKILKTKRDLLEKEILELNEKIKKLERSKEIKIACKSCEELKSENAKLKETQVKFVKFDKSANSLREMLNNQKSPSCKIGLGFDDSKASTSGTKNMSFVGSSAEKATDESTIKVHGSTLPGSVSRTYGEKGTKHVFSPPMSSRLDFVITRKKTYYIMLMSQRNHLLKPAPKRGHQGDVKEFGLEDSKFNQDADVNRASRLHKGRCSRTPWIALNIKGLDELEKTLEQIKPYNSRLSTLDDIRNLIHKRTVHEKIDKEGNTIHKLPNQIKTNELFDHLRPCKLVIRENVYSAIGNKDHTQAVIALMLYCLENRKPFNLAYFIIRRMYFFRDRRDKVLPYGIILTRLFKNLKANMEQGLFDERYKPVARKMSSLKAKQPKKPPPKRTRNVGKSKRTQLSTSSSIKSPPYNNRELPSTNSPRSYSKALKDDPNMSKEQRETRGMFKNLGRALHNFLRLLKKGCW